ncbi:MAG: HEAT repeat domain-containing protein, partial [Lachnospiraceae bacterium]|nr:HEAT repeat domain-containing protein [Lachnospiraceae bacterium]
TLADPKLAAAFMKYSQNQNPGVRDLSDVMFRICYENFLTAMKNSLDLTDQKASGMQVEYINRSMGYAENDWYVALAKNEKCPKNIRVKAIEALACSEKNTGLLLELYTWQSGRLKRAALTALAKLSPPEAEAVFEKLTAKFNDRDVIYISESSGRVCTEFARQKFFEAVENKEIINYETWKGGLIDSQIHPAVLMLKNKSTVDDCFITLVESTPPRVYDKIIDVNEMLVENLAHHRNDAYRTLIMKLYDRYPDVFYPSRFFLALISHPETALDEMRDIADNHRNRILDILKNIYYCTPLKEYQIAYSTKNTDYDPYYNEYTPVKFETIPENILDYIAGTKVPKNATEAKSIYKDSKRLLKRMRYKYSELDFKRLESKITGNIL